MCYLCYIGVSACIYTCYLKSIAKSIFTAMHTTVLKYYDVRTCFFNRRTTGQHSANYVSRQFLWLAGNSRYSCLSLVRLACGTACVVRASQWAGLCGLEGAAGRSHTLLSIVMQKFSSRKSGKSGTTMSTLCDVWYK